MSYNSRYLHTQNDLLIKNLLVFFQEEINLSKMMTIIQGKTGISLRIVDWFVTNYAKKYFVVYDVGGERFKVYNDYKLKLKAYSKRRFDPFQRWERITIERCNNPTQSLQIVDSSEDDEIDDDKTKCAMETTIGQLNFFKWAIENNILDYIHENYVAIEADMNERNSISKKRGSIDSISSDSTVDGGKTRKKREELSISATKCIKKETVKIIVKFT
jgi:hypothetical protein